MERAYYIVRPGKIKDAVQNHEDCIARQRAEIFKALKQMALATGCNPETCLIEKNACVGLVFDRGLPPASVCKWKKIGESTYWPSLSTKRGKAIAEVFAFARPTCLEDVLSARFESCMRVGEVFVVTGTYDEMRADGPEFEADEDIRTQLLRIKPSEFQRMIDEYGVSR